MKSTSVAEEHHELKFFSVANNFDTEDSIQKVLAPCECNNVSFSRDIVSPGQTTRVGLHIKMEDFLKKEKLETPLFIVWKSGKQTILHCIYKENFGLIPSLRSITWKVGDNLPKTIQFHFDKTIASGISSEGTEEFNFLTTTNSFEGTIIRIDISLRIVYVEVKPKHPAPKFDLVKFHHRTQGLTDSITIICNAL